MKKAKPCNFLLIKPPSEKLNADAKHNFAAYSDLSIEIKDLEQIKGLRDLLTSIGYKLLKILIQVSVKRLSEMKQEPTTVCDTQKVDLSIMVF